MTEFPFTNSSKTQVYLLLLPQPKEIVESQKICDISSLVQLHPYLLSHMYICTFLVLKLQSDDTHTEPDTSS